MKFKTKNFETEIEILKKLLPNLSSQLDKMKYTLS